MRKNILFAPEQCARDIRKQPQLTARPYALCSTYRDWRDPSA